MGHGAVVYHVSEIGTVQNDIVNASRPFIMGITYGTLLGISRDQIRLDFVDKESSQDECEGETLRCSFLKYLFSKLSIKH